MSVLSHNTMISNFSRIFSTGLVAGGYQKDSVDVHTSPTCRCSPKYCSYGLGKTDPQSDVAIVMHKSRACKKFEIYQVENTVLILARRPTDPDMCLQSVGMG